MEYGMVSMLIPKEYEETFRTCAKHTMQDAANALQWNLYQGFCENLGQDIPLFNTLPCGSYPQYYSRPFVPRFSFDAKGQNLAFCNVKVIRNRFRAKAIRKALLKWCQSSAEPKTLFIYTISQPLLAAVAAVKKKFPQLHVCAIVADLPSMSNLSSKQGRLLRMFSARKAKGSYSLLSSVDSFVLLTKHMVDYMHITQPFCVMEGIAPATSDMHAESETVGREDEKMILYAGTLHRKFGVLHLLDAFRRVSDSRARLVICGIGDSETEIREASQQDPRIDFRGQLSRDEVLALQRRAAVLVNPRLNNEEFTKYSFPSKTMEYLASGIPVVAYKLDGIPDEYDAYITYPDGNSSDALAVTLERLCALPSDELARMGREAQQFVSVKKNKNVQTQKILDFVQKVIAADKD